MLLMTSLLMSMDKLTSHTDIKAMKTFIIKISYDFSGLDIMYL